MDGLREYARQNGITQRKLAQMLGIKPQQLNDWLQGRREPTPEMILFIVEMLNQPAKRRKARGVKPGDKPSSGMQ
jgi:transcriptional regulator with XRE-family HTH domain